VAPVYQRNEDIPMADMAYPETQPPMGRAYPPGPGPNPPPRTPRHRPETTLGIGLHIQNYVV
jgi:hypothetical protein